MEGDEESEEEDPYMQDPQLAGLMTGSQHTTRDLTGMAKAKAKTRAAAGYSKSPRKERVVDRDFGRKSETDRGGSSKRPATVDEDDQSVDDDKDDLDGPAIKSSKQKPPVSMHPADYVNERHFKPAQHETDRSESSNFFKRFTSKSSEGKHSDQRTKAHHSPTIIKDNRADEGIKQSFLTDTTIMSKTSEQSQARSDFLAKRRAAREKKEQEEKRKSQRMDDVPTWLV